MLNGYNSQNISKNYVNGHVGQIVDADMILSTFADELTGNKTNAVVLTPVSGKRLCIRSVQAVVNGNAGTIALDFATSGKKVFRHYATATSRADTKLGHIIGNIDEPLTLNATSLGANLLFLVINYTVHD